MSDISQHNASYIVEQGTFFFYFGNWPTYFTNQYGGNTDTKEAWLEHSIKGNTKSFAYTTLHYTTENVLQLQ